MMAEEEEEEDGADLQAVEMMMVLMGKEEQEEQELQKFSMFVAGERFRFRWVHHHHLMRCGRGGCGVGGDRVRDDVDGRLVVGLL